MMRRHSMPFGAEFLGGGRTRFRLWAPSAKSVELVLASGTREHRVEMSRDGNGWAELTLDAPAGTRYRYRVDRDLLVPDPASRFNPEDVHGPSEVIDAGAYTWRDERWQGRAWDEAVIYELHVGAFSPEGTFAGVERRLDYLRDLGVTAVELMPIADFPGKRNWGYDGVLPFAPDATYGRPEDLKRLVDAAHERGLMMFLDVVYNHFGPEGNYLNAYACDFFTERHKTDWGAAINFDGPSSRAVRDFFIHNALYWLEEYHFDGLRFDAVHAIVDESEPHILIELSEAVRSGPGARRHIHLMLENDRNEARYLRYTADGKPRHYNAQWADDFHHAFHVQLTGETDGYYGDYAGPTTQHLGRCLAEGFAYQGEPSPFRNGKPRGEPCAELPPSAFVTFLQNHDQTGNRAFGERLVAIAGVERLRAATVAWLLAPARPMLFMGEEFGAASPFLFFCDFGPELAQAVSTGRRREFARFEQFSSEEMQARIPDPNHPDTFERSRLDWLSVKEPAHWSWLGLYQALLSVRAEHVVPRLAGMGGHAGRHTVVADSALLVTWLLGDQNELELRLNLSDTPASTPVRPRGRLLHCEPASAAQAFAAGELPANAAAVYLGR
jgi:maltooligosyltrehalose trehalohydrolase